MDDTLPAPAARSRLASIFVGADGLRAGWSLVLFVVFVVLTVLGLGLAIRLLDPPLPVKGLPSSPIGVIDNDLIMLIAVVVPAAIMALIERRRFSRYNVGGRDRLTAFGKGLLSGFAMLSILIGLLAATGSISFGGTAISGGAILVYGGEWLLAFFLVGLAEEFSFRGYLQFTLARGVAGMARWLGHDTPKAPAIGFWVAAIVFSVILFAVVHTFNAGETPLGIFQVALAGFVFVFSLWWTGSLWWAIGFHTAWDWAQSYFYGVADSGMVSAGHLLITAPAGNALLSGGTTGPEGSVLCIPVLLASMALVWKTMPRGIPPVLDGEA